MFGYNLWSITQIKIADQIGKVLKESHPIQKAFDWGLNELYRKDTMTIGINWGVEPSLILNPNQTYWQAKDDGII
jgi:hypothetical protein